MNLNDADWVDVIQFLILFLNALYAWLKGRQADRNTDDVRKLEIEIKNAGGSTWSKRVER